MFLFTFVPEREPPELWVVLEPLHAYDVVRHEPDDGRLVLLDEPGPGLGLLARLAVDEADEALQRHLLDDRLEVEHERLARADDALVVEHHDL